MIASTEPTMRSSSSVTTGASIHRQSSSDTSKSRSIEQQLADTRQAQHQRRQEMSASMAGSTGTLTRVYRALKTDHNTTRLALICISMVCSLFGSMLLAIVGDPPYHEGAIYQYNDLMRLASQIHDKSIEIKPNLSKESWKAEMQNTSTSEESHSKLSRLMQEWWPIRRIDFESNDAILNDRNFYSRNYQTFQTAFIVLVVLGDAILLISWLYFLAAKELKIYRYKNSYSDKVANGSATPKSMSESTSELFGRIKRFLQGKQLKKLKRSWLDDAPRRPWEKRSFVWIMFTLAMHCVLFCILSSRPNMFALVLHQVVFVCMAVICLASTEVHPTQQESSKMTPQEPRSLRGSYNNRIHFRSPVLSGVQEEKVSSPNGETVIFVTEQSAKVSSNDTKVKYPPNNNPFDEEEEKNKKEINKVATRSTEKVSIDEEVEKEVEQV